MPIPRNWRTQATAQADALPGVLAEIGVADAVLARQTAVGLELLDSYLPAEVASDSMIAVLIMDVTDSEAEKILATRDPLAAIAEADAAERNAAVARPDPTGRIS